MLNILLFVPDSQQQGKLSKLLKSKLDYLYCNSIDEVLNSLKKNHIDGLIIDLQSDESLQLMFNPEYQKRQRSIDLIIGLGFPDHISGKSLRFDACFDLNKQNVCASIDIFINSILREKHHAGKKRYSGMPLVGQSAAHNRIMEQANTICDANVHLLITGETGVGKTALARYIHHQSGRAEYPFMPINCASIPENLLESELFGYKKGAFTGADSNHQGKFLAAEAGTILLDEIGEISLFLQAKLLKVLDERSLYPVGDVNPFEVRARIIAATNTDLYKAVKEKKFRQDLYYRLNTIEINIPPLRERSEDIEMLFRYFVEREVQDLGIPHPEIEPAVLEILSNYNWPGNIRQVQNTVKALLSLKPQEISVNILPSYLVGEMTSIIHEGVKNIQPLDWIKKEYAAQVYKNTGYNKLKTARLLNIDIKTLRKLL